MAMSVKKFRSWISSIQRFVYFENGVYSYQRMQDNKDLFDWDKSQQFTGLLDKNGVEIYEGDIVKLQYVSQPLEVNYSTVTASFIMGREHRFMPLSDLEVIGNIYENGELLEQ